MLLLKNIIHACINSSKFTTENHCYIAVYFLKFTSCFCKKNEKMNRASKKSKLRCNKIKDSVTTRDRRLKIKKIINVSLGVGMQFGFSKNIHNFFTQFENCCV